MMQGTLSRQLKMTRGGRLTAGANTMRLGITKIMKGKPYTDCSESADIPFRFCFAGRTIRRGNLSDLLDELFERGMSSGTNGPKIRKYITNCAEWKVMCLPVQLIRATDSPLRADSSALGRVHGDYSPVRRAASEDPGESTRRERCRRPSGVQTLIGIKQPAKPQVASWKFARDSGLGCRTLASHLK